MTEEATNRLPAGIGHHHLLDGAYGYLTPWYIFFQNFSY